MTVSQSKCTQRPTPRTAMTTVAGWSLGSTLGRGAYAHVRGAVHSFTSEVAACKILPAFNADGTPSWDEVVDAVDSHKEVVLLRALQGAGVPGVITLEGFKQVQGWNYIFMQHVPTTSRNLPSSSPRVVVPFFRKLLLAVQALHDLDVAHGDLKPANVLIDKAGNPCIVDFGFGSFSPTQALVGSSGGTAEYSSPEKTGDRFYDPKMADIWALGIILLKYLNRPHPYQPDRYNEGDQNITDHIVYGEPTYRWKVNEVGAGRLSELVTGMLHRESIRRWTIKRCLVHPYLATPDSAYDRSPYKPPRLHRPLTLPRQLPDRVIIDLMFLAYLSGDFYLCQSATVVLENLETSAGARWEKRWAGMLHTGWQILRRKERARSPVPLQVQGTKGLKPIHLSPIDRAAIDKSPKRSILTEKPVHPRNDNIPQSEGETLMIKAPTSLTMAGLSNPSAVPTHKNSKRLRGKITLQSGDSQMGPTAASESKD